jgi:HAMP domain-containing protein
VDRNGYLPTHNSPFGQQYTGNSEKDKTINQTKRVFNDSVGLKAARNTTPGLLQIYPTEAGKMLWDISSPIQVKDQHWGGFRIGISLVKIEEAKKELTLTLLGIMISILLALFLLIFIILNWSLASVSALSDTANGLAAGQSLDSEINVTEKNEIGELQQALERMRISMLIALKQRKKS